MNILSASGLRQAYGENVLFEDLTIGLAQGEKAALVGINGCGKSTLLRILTGETTPQAGEVSVRNEIRMTFLNQNPTFSPEKTVWETIFETENEKIKALKAYEDYIANPELVDDPTHILEQADALDIWSMEAEIKEVFDKLLITDYNMIVGKASGGQRKRIALAKALLENPDFIVMDEPTNHLDLEVIEWLEQKIMTLNRTLLLVTHDRYFLDSICNVILELDRGVLYRHNGNYSDFLQAKAERIEQQNVVASKAQNLLKKEAEWMRRQPKARGTKAKYRVEAFGDLQKKAGNTYIKEDMLIESVDSRQGKKILEIKDLKKSFGDKKIIENFDYIFRAGDRAAIIGPNGVGKSTFLNILAGREPADGGIIDMGKNTRVGYYTQESNEMPGDKRLLEYVTDIAEMIEQAGGTIVSAADLLSRFGFEHKKQFAYIRTLSGGERRRLQLLGILVGAPNFLILDEPTNDFDILTLNVLEEFLLQFKGCLLIASHDRYFTDRLAEHSFVFEGDGMIRDFPGNYTDYRSVEKDRKKEEAEKEKKFKTATVFTPKSGPSDGPAKLTYNEKRELKDLDSGIEKLESEKAGLTEKLGSGAGSSEEIIEWSIRIGKIDKELETKTERWMELSERA